jgi:malonyl CoA-acyl carrier protein transacylase/acyl carrier protein
MRGVGEMANDIWGMTVALFPGQGAFNKSVLDRVNAKYPQVTEVFREIDEATEQDVGIELSKLLLDSPAGATLHEILEDNRLVQLAVFAFDVAAYRVLRSEGFEPDVHVGFSLGEVAALTCAGAYSVVDAARLVLHRSKEMRELDLTGAGMAVITTNVERSQRLIDLIGDSSLTVALENHDAQTILAGPRAALDLAGRLAGVLGMSFARLQSMYPAHTPLLQPAVAAFIKDIRDLPQQPLSVPVYSPALERYYDSDESLAEAIATQLVKPVRFSTALRKLYQDGARVFIECGALATLTTFVKKNLPVGNLLALAPFDRTENGVDHLDSALELLRHEALLAGVDRDAAAALLPDVGKTEFATFWAARGNSIVRHLREEFDSFERSRLYAPAILEVPTREILQPADSNGVEQSREEVLAAVRKVYADALEYPEEVFTEDAHLEAELGIDSVKQVELQARLRDHYDVGALPEDYRLADYNTLGKIADWFMDHISPDQHGGSRPSQPPAASR